MCEFHGHWEVMHNRKTHAVCSGTRKRLVAMAGLGMAALAAISWVPSTPLEHSQNISSMLQVREKLQQAHGWPIHPAHQLRGPFPRIGMYGHVPQVDANLIDDREEPQVQAPVYTCRDETIHAFFF
jgi:hypothetical protein